MIDLGAVKAHLRVDTDAEDALVQRYLDNAVQAVEQRSGHVLNRRIETARFKAFPAAGRMFTLPRDPVLAIVSVGYFDADGAPVTIAADELRFVEGEPAFVLPTLGTSWPATAADMPVTVSYVAGYHVADDADEALQIEGYDDLDWPGGLEAAVLMTVGHYYANREEGAAGTSVAAIPMGVDAHIQPYRRIALG